VSPLAVALVVNGALVGGAPPARLVLGHVMVPLAPVVARLADRAVVAGDAIAIVRGESGCRFRIGGTQAVCNGRAAPVSVLPFTADGTVFVALADLARAWDATVTYDARTRTAAVVLAPATALRTPQPFDPLAPQAPPTQVFTPSPPPASPRPFETGIPHPRRTAIPEVPSRTPG
jgi:hypothetical protein